MSDFMKSIVQEVLKPNQSKQKPKENPLFAKATRHLYTKTVQTNQRPSIQGIHRPNYQKENQQKRLSALTDSARPAEKVMPKQPAMRKSVQPQMSTNFHEGSLSSLQKMALTQGNKAARNYTAKTQQIAEKSQLIGESKDGLKAWLFSGLHPKLQESFQRPLQANSIGVLTAETCTAGQLFLLNDILREYAGIKYFLSWDKNSKQRFVLELYDHDHTKVTGAVKILFQKLSQTAYKQIQVYQSQLPSPWLLKQFDLKMHVNGLAAVECLDYYSSIFLLDQFLKKKPNSDFDYVIADNYLLLYGDYDTVVNAADALQKAAGKIR